MKSIQPLRGVFCGAGQFARIQLEAWRQVPGVEWVGLCNRTLERAVPLAREFNIARTHTDLAVLLHETRPDFVDICTAVDQHVAQTLLAVDRRIAVLCQKPLTPSLETSCTLVRTCRAAGVRLMVNENWRWQSWWREVKRQIEAGALGSLHHVHLALRPGDGHGDSPYPQQPFFRDLKRFLLFETGCHYLDTLRFLCGEVSSVYSLTRQLNPGIQGEDAALVVCRHASGVTSIFDGNRVSATQRMRSPANGWALIEGSDSVLRLDPEGSLWIARRGQSEQPHPYPRAGGYRGGSAEAAQSHFVDCLRSGRPFESDGLDYLKTEALVAAAYRSAESGSTEIPEIPLP